jgi:CHRD domain
MGHAMSRYASMAGACLILAAGSGLALAAPYSFKVPLSGAQEVPPVQTPATGTADLTYDPSSRVVTWVVTTSGVASPVTMAHFHGPATAGKNAAPAVWLTEKGSAVEGPVKGQATLTAEQAEQFLSGQMYINVHSKDHPSGEMRGQVIPPKQ